MMETSWFYGDAWKGFFESCEDKIEYGLGLDYVDIFIQYMEDVMLL